MIWLYRALSPLFLIIFILRLIKGKEDPKRFKERLGIASKARPEGTLLWLHGASVGETINLLPLIKALKADNPQLHILLTSGTRTSADLMKKRLPEGVIHQFVPLDTFFSVALFMQHWQPDLSVFMESEFWPELLTQAPNPMLINARISDGSFKKYTKHKNLIAPLLHKFKICLGREVQDTERLQQLGAERASTMGNLKYDTPLPSYNSQELKQLQAELKDRKIILLSSTHNPEELDLVTAIHAKKELKDCLIIVVPRHPQRGEHIAEELNLNPALQLRSYHAKLSKEHQVYIANTVGEMGLWLQLAHVVIIGGSFINHGGQTPIESVKSGRLTFTGPHMQNFSETMRDLKKADAVISVETKGELVLKLTEYITNNALLKAKEQSLKGAMDHLGGALDIAKNQIEKELN